jgi:5-deoxy-glucuronate isomerase
VTDLVVPTNERPDEDGSIVKVTPESAGWGYVGFEVLRLAAGESVERRTGGEEVCLVVISGVCFIVTESEEWEIGGRKGPFDGLPHALYLPPGTDYRVEASEELELAICSAPAEQGVEPFGVRPEDIEVERRGSGNMEREVRPILMGGVPPNACSSSRS